MRIAGSIGFLVMNAMRGYPENRAAFKRECAANGKQILKSPWHLVRPVRVQPMVAHADAQPGGKPEQEKRDSQVRPTEHEEGGDGPHVQNHQHDNGWPIQSLISKFVEIGDHRLFQSCRHYDSTLTG